MDENARHHHSRAVTAYLQGEAVTSVPWPAMGPDLNPIEHIRPLEAALHREWKQLSQQDNRRLTGGKRRMVDSVTQSRGGCILY